MEEMICERDEF